MQIAWQIAWNDADIFMSLHNNFSEAWSDLLSLDKFLMALTYFWPLYVNFLLAFSYELQLKNKNETMSCAFLLTVSFLFDAKK